MAYVVIKNNNKQSYTLRNTANKPRVVLKSNGTSYIPSTNTSSYDYGYNVEVGNTTTSVQTTTEV